jgi:hypothetical protein
MNGGYRGCNLCIERHLAIFVNYFCLERTNQLSLLPDKDLVDLCSPIEPYQVTPHFSQRKRMECLKALPSIDLNPILAQLPQRQCVVRI